MEKIPGVPEALESRNISSKPRTFSVLCFVAGVSGSGTPQLSTLTPVPPPVVTSDGATTTLKYQQQPGGDTLSAFVTLVCQEAQNAVSHSSQVRAPPSDQFLLHEGQFLGKATDNTGGSFLNEKENKKKQGDILTV